MKRFSAQYIITGTGTTLKRGIITTDNNGTITSISDTGGNLRETGHTTFYNGIIIPGMVNCHCHIELSSMKGIIPRSTLLPGFIKYVKEQRNKFVSEELHAIIEADSDMYDSGINACADICNNSLSFEIKEKSKIEYINLLEIFGTAPGEADNRIADIRSLAAAANNYAATWYITPHSLYSLSLPLLKKVKNLTAENKITSIHFMESATEKEMMDHRISNHADAILSLVTRSGNLLLVHNTRAEDNDIKKVMQRDNTWWCLCPLSNRYIEEAEPPVQKLREHGAEIVLGTDSLASNSTLSIMDEMKAIASSHPSIPLTELVQWATANGARALGIDHKLGSIEKGKTPGLLLLENIDLEQPRLNNDVTLKRLI